MFHIFSSKKIEHYRVSFCIRTYSDGGLVCDDQESWINTDRSHTWSWKKLQGLCIVNSGMLKSDKRKGGVKYGWNPVWHLWRLSAFVKKEGIVHPKAGPWFLWHKTSFFFSGRPLHSMSQGFRLTLSSVLFAYNLTSKVRISKDDYFLVLLLGINYIANRNKKFMDPHGFTQKLALTSFGSDSLPRSSPSGLIGFPFPDYYVL